MKVSKEVILKLEISGIDLENFIAALEKVILAESGAHLGIGILKKEEVEVIIQIIKNSK